MGTINRIEVCAEGLRRTECYRLPVTSSEENVTEYYWRRNKDEAFIDNLHSSSIYDGAEQCCSG
jgi:hypothetical protein